MPSDRDILLGPKGRRNSNLFAGRRLAIVCQPWDNVALQPSGSISIIAHHLARQLADDWHVTLCGRRGPGQKRREIYGKNIEFRRFTVFQKPQSIIEVILGIVARYKKTCIPFVLSYCYHFLYALRIALSVRNCKINVVILFNFIQFAAIIKLFNPTVKICLHMQCDWMTEFAAASERRLRAVDLICGCSDYITKRIRTAFPEVAARCHTVYNGVDPTIFCPAQRLRTEDNRARRLLYVGRLSTEKGVHVLIQAFKILAERRPALQLDLIGAADTPKYIYSCPDLQDPAIASLQPFYGNTLFDMVRRQLILRNRGYLNDLVTDAAGDDRISFRGGLAHSDTIDFYRGATVVVSPSIWHEPFGIPNVEAMACGVPVVSTFSGGIPEIVEQARTGILVARGDARELALAIGQLLDNPILARAMGEAGRQRAIERFSWEVVSRRLADLIESLSSVGGPDRVRQQDSS